MKKTVLLAAFYAACGVTTLITQWHSDHPMVVTSACGGALIAIAFATLERGTRR